MSQTVFITGSSSGFGKLIVKTLLSKGYTVFATMRNLKSKNATVAKDLSSYAEDQEGALHLIELDVTDDSSVNAAVYEALDRAGEIDVLINNAGVGNGGYTEAFTAEQFQSMFNINVIGVQRVTRALLKSMREKAKGLIINISSVMGRIVIPFAGPYTASKFALEGLTESYRYELAPSGIDVAIVEPGGFGTNFMENLIPPKDEDRVKSYGELAGIPEQMWSGFAQMLESGQAPDPQIVADAVVNLIETPAGERPLRTVVDPMSGGQAPSAINQTTDQIQEQLLAGLGMGDTASVKEG